MAQLPDITFINKTAADVEAEVMAAWQAASGRTLAPGDPVRLFLLSQAAYISQLIELVNAASKQNLLAYATGGHLDHLGAFLGLERKSALPAVTTLRFSIDRALDWAVLIPQGTRVGAADKTAAFATVKSVQIPAGALYADVTAQCTEGGTVGNGYAAGELSFLVDPVGYVSSAANIEGSSGGADDESDEEFRKRIREAPESFSAAGPSGAYEYFAKNADVSIMDVSVIGPEDEPGNVYVYPLMEGGELPSQSILDLVERTLNDEKVRPLSDRVFVKSPEQVTYDTEIVYSISTEDTTGAASIQSAVTQAVAEWQVWQRSKLGRDINPSELIRRVMDAGALRVTVISPAHTVLEPWQVSVPDNTSIRFGGLEDG